MTQELLSLVWSKRNREAAKYRVIEMRRLSCEGLEDGSSDNPRFRKINVPGLVLVWVV